MSNKATTCYSKMSIKYEASWIVVRAEGTFLQGQFTANRKLVFIQQNTTIQYLIGLMCYTMKNILVS